jgi:hypothetical protein
MQRQCHYSATSVVAAGVPPPAHSFSLMTEPSAACHSISPVASFWVHLPSAKPESLVVFGYSPDASAAALFSLFIR